VWLTLICVACAISDKEHDPTSGEAPSVTVKAFWRDAAGEKHLVGGLLVDLERAGDSEQRRQVCSAEQPLRFVDLPPGDYVLRVRGQDVPPVDYAFVLPEGKRVTVRVDVEAVVAGAAGDAALVDGMLYVLGDAVTRLQAAGVRASQE